MVSHCTGDTNLGSGCHVIVQQPRRRWICCLLKAFSTVGCDSIEKCNLRYLALWVKSFFAYNKQISFLETYAERPWATPSRPYSE